MTYDWLQLQCALDGVAVPDRITYLSVNGTGVDMWTGFPADIGRALDDERFYWQPIGYPGATFPMGPSVDAGVTELLNQINLHPGQLVLCGYSQGALVVAKAWRDHILNGSLNHRLPDVIGIITFGDPMRCPGIANGNVFAGQGLPQDLDGQTTGGIAGPDCLTPDETPTFFLSFANDGDLYACAPVGADPWHNESAAGADETLIYNIVQNATVADVQAIAEEVLQVIEKPWTQVVPLVGAIYNGGLFFSLGANAAHYTYKIDAAVAWLNQLANLQLVV